MLTISQKFLKVVINNLILMLLRHLLKGQVDGCILLAKYSYIVRFRS
jgi:hypothetical protein